MWHTRCASGFTKGSLHSLQRPNIAVMSGPSDMTWKSSNGIKFASHSVPIERPQPGDHLRSDIAEVSRGSDHLSESVATSTNSFPLPFYENYEEACRNVSRKIHLRQNLPASLADQMKAREISDTYMLRSANRSDLPLHASDMELSQGPESMKKPIFLEAGREEQLDLNLGTVKSIEQLSLSDTKSFSRAVSNETDSLRFTIPEKTMQRIKASVDPTERYWRFTLYESDAKETPKAHYCTKSESFERIAAHFENETVLGFDLEWKGSASLSDPWWHNVSVLQLASQSHIGVFHLAQAALRKQSDVSKLEKENLQTAGQRIRGVLDGALSPDDVFPPNLRAILESDKIIKAGVNISGDRTRMMSHCGVTMAGTLELSHLHKLVKYSKSEEHHKIDRKAVSMALQVQEHLLLPINKSDVRVSDWSLQRLDKDQITYAASDAYAGLMLFHTLETKRRALQPSPPRPLFEEAKAPIRLADGIALQAKKPIKPARSYIQSETSLSSTCDTDPRALFTDADGARLLQDANIFVQDWQAMSRPETDKFSAASLRAYYLWHYGSLSLDRICRLLRSPPLQMSTVARYIWNATKAEGLTYDRKRLNEEVAAQIYQWRGRHGSAKA